MIQLSPIKYFKDLKKVKIRKVLICSYIPLLILASGHFRANAGTSSKPIQDTILVTNFGAKPNSRENVVMAVQAALKVCKEKSNPVLVFPRGRYDFWPQHAIEKEYFESNTTDNNPKTLGVLIAELKNLTIDGKGSSFIYHGRMQPFTIDNSTNISIKNVDIDWDFPLTAQAEIKAVTDDYIDILIDEKQYPYEIENSKLVFVGEGWKSGIRAFMEYNFDTHIIAPQTGDDPALGKGWQNYNAEKRNGGIVRLHHQFKRKPAVKNILIIRHSARDHAGIFITGSKDVKLQKINLYHCTGLGILSQRSENLGFKNINIIPNAAKGRYFSGHDDGMHFSGCRGKIEIDSCRFAGLMDDPINIHGIYVKIIKKTSPNKLVCRFMENMSVGMVWATPGESIAFIDHHSLQTKGTTVVKTARKLNNTDFELTLTEPIPAAVEINNGLENLNWTPSATITNSMLESCRARGILVTTPKRVIIQNNTFRSSGSAILIAGDVNSWYESGAVNDVLISKNTFESSCLTSNYQFSEAIISIYPEVPVINEKTPTYHRNIHIVGNEFHPYDYPILFAQSVSGLKFERNFLKRNYEYKPFHTRKVSFSLLGCRNVSIRHNEVGNDVLGKNVKTSFMKSSDLKLQNDLVWEK